MVATPYHWRPSTPTSVPPEALLSSPTGVKAPGGDLSARTRSRIVSVHPLADTRVAAARAAFTTRRVPSARMQTLISGSVRPRSGDLVLATIARLGYQTRIELANGRKASLHLGDEVIVAYADRY